MNADYWLDKVARESRHTREFGHLLQNKFALKPVKRATCTYSAVKIENFLPSATNFSQPAATWIVFRQVWTWLVKCGTSLFNSFCSNVARQVAGFCLLPVLSLLIKSRLFRSDANLYDIFYQTVTYAATTSYVYNRPLYAQLIFDRLLLDKTWRKREKANDGVVTQNKRGWRRCC